MIHAVTKTFKSGDGVGLRIPKRFGFGVDVLVRIEWKGDCFVMTRLDEIVADKTTA